MPGYIGGDATSIWLILLLILIAFLVFLPSFGIGYSK